MDHSKLDAAVAKLDALGAREDDNTRYKVVGIRKSGKELDLGQTYHGLQRSEAERRGKMFVDMNPGSSFKIVEDPTDYAREGAARRINRYLAANR